jgi:hypothetical protein
LQILNLQSRAAESNRRETSVTPPRIKDPCGSCSQLNLDDLPSASCIPDTHIDLLIYIGGKLAGLSDRKQISLWWSDQPAECFLRTGRRSNRAISRFTFKRWSLGFLYGVVSNMEVLRAREAYIVCNSRLEPTARVVGYQVVPSLSTKWNQFYGQ